MKTDEVIEKYADKLMSTLGDIAPEAWDIMVRGQVSEGLRGLLMSTFLAVTSVALARWCVHSKRKTEEVGKALDEWRAKEMSKPFRDRDHRRGLVHVPDYSVAVGAGCAAFLISFMAALGFGDAIMHLLSPEYMALKELMEHG